MAGHMASLPPAYVNGVRASDDEKRFPVSYVFAGFNAPSRIEGSLRSLEVRGKIPDAINGTYYSVNMDHRFPPKYENDLLFNGDGCVCSFEIENGRVDWKRRYVQTDRYKVETAANRSLFGRYRNPFTDDPSTKGMIRTAANTNVYFWRGIILAVKEDGPPFAMDPLTLETYGRYDFDGQMLSPTFSAHPKVDPATGDMLCFGNTAGGDGNCCSNDLVYYMFDQDGKKTEEVWFKTPYCGFIHDFAFTDNHIIIPLSPLIGDLERLKNGGNYWAWDPEEYQYIGIAPRRGAKPEDMVWVRTANGFQGHIAGGYEKDGKLIFDLTMADGNVFFWFPEASVPADVTPGPNKFHSPMTRYEFDIKTLKTTSSAKPSFQKGFTGEFARIDDRFNGKYYTNYWMLGMDMGRQYDFPKCGPPPGGLFNLLIHYNWETHKEDIWWPGPTTTVQEPCFVPMSADAPEGIGYIVALLNRLDLMTNEFAVFDAQNIAAGPIALCLLPLRPKSGFHGNFVDHQEIRAFTERRRVGGDIGPVRAAAQPLPWQLKLISKV